MVHQIRQIEGFSSFLQRTPYDTLRQAASKGPVILVNISRHHSDALIVRYSDSPFLVPLPKATPLSVAELTMKLYNAIKLDSEPSQAPKKRAAIAEVLGSLWVQIVHPVVQVLDSLGMGSNKTRIWWIPTFVAWKLPLHAAGIYEPGGDKLLNRFISSYTPTLSLLIRSIKPRTDPRPARLLVVTVPVAEKEQKLTSLDEEVRKIWDLAPGLTHLNDRNATRTSVLSSIIDHSWVHFACHGHQDLNQPFESRFVMTGEPLRLNHIIKDNIDCAEFAFLAACHSASGDLRAPDESIHLAAGMQFVGYRGVVGTMWAMADVDGPVLAEVFYNHMFRKEGHVECSDAATALAKGIRVLRREGVPFERWINFVHYGT